MDVHELLLKVQNHEVDLASAEEYLKKLPYEDLGFAKLDHHRRCAPGLARSFTVPERRRSIWYGYSRALRNERAMFSERGQQREQFAAVREVLPEAVYEELSRTIYLQYNVPKLEGRIAVCTGGTSDIPVAEEAARTAEFFGCYVDRIYDVGVAGIHRLLSKAELIRKANCVVAIAGMEGALAGVIAGLVDKPVIGVPTSVGYGANMQGMSALLTMINSCAEGVSVVNIDNGFGAGYMAAQINRLATGADRT